MPMKSDFYYESQCGGKLHGCRWTPDAPPKGVVQLVHGIAEHLGRYDRFARFLNEQGYLVVGEDHMGHGQSITPQSPMGYFQGGWFAAVADTYQLLLDTKAEFPDLPYVLFGHSMGSFMVRTILAKYPDSGIAGAIICGTGKQPAFMLAAGKLVSLMIGRLQGDTQPNPLIRKLSFGSYNSRVEHSRTSSDWLTRDEKIVDEAVADPLCGFPASPGLFRSMLNGISYIQDRSSLRRMKKDLPVYFIAGGDDPVGPYGKGVKQVADSFRKAGMESVEVKIYPLCRHEILNEINWQEVHGDVAKWLTDHVE